MRVATTNINARERGRRALRGASAWRGLVGRPWDVGAGRVGPACVPKNYKKNARETADPRHHDPAHWEHLVVRVAILAAPSPTRSINRQSGIGAL